jgi:hypothetical protein
MKMPEPMIPPITIIVASKTPNCRASFGLLLAVALSARFTCRN